MKDLNNIPASRLPQADQNKSQSLKSFFDDWPQPQECTESDDPSSMEVKKWRLQILLAVNPYGIPSLKYGQAYERMFGRKFDLREFGCDSLTELTNKMPDVFVVQEPDEVTAILFPDYRTDRVLHDARLGLNFAEPKLDDPESLLEPTTRIQASGTTNDFSDLIIRAWMDRDEEFPPDVVLAGESYEQLLKVSSANIPGTRGLYQATIISAASPEAILIQLKSSDEDVARIRGLSSEIEKYFKDSNRSIDAYSVPKEFMLPGFPCLLYLGKQRNWERCIIAGRSHGDNKIIVESIDFGGTYAVHQIFLYLIPRQFLQLPRQSLQVSLLGVKPLDGKDEWPKQTGSRLRCFSYENYFLDILLMEPKFEPTVATKQSDLDFSSSCGSSVDRSSSRSSAGSDEIKPIRRNFKSRTSYEALIVDRNDQEMDLFLDEVLGIETYAKPDPDRFKEITEIKELFKDALTKIPRPKNPFE